MSNNLEILGGPKFKSKVFSPLLPWTGSKKSDKRLHMLMIDSDLMNQPHISDLPSSYKTMTIKSQVKSKNMLTSKRKNFDSQLQGNLKQSKSPLRKRITKKNVRLRKRHSVCSTNHEQNHKNLTQKKKRKTKLIDRKPKKKTKKKSNKMKKIESSVYHRPYQRGKEKDCVEIKKSVVPNVEVTIALRKQNRGLAANQKKNLARNMKPISVPNINNRKNNEPNSKNQNRVKKIPQNPEENRKLYDHNKTSKLMHTIRNHQLMSDEDQLRFVIPLKINCPEEKEVSKVNPYLNNLSPLYSKNKVDIGLPLAIEKKSIIRFTRSIPTNIEHQRRLEEFYHHKKQPQPTNLSKKGVYNQHHLPLYLRLKKLQSTFGHSQSWPRQNKRNRNMKKENSDRISIVVTQRLVQKWSNFRKQQQEVRNRQVVYNGMKETRKRSHGLLYAKEMYFEDV